MKNNFRKQYAAKLRELSDTEILVEQQKVLNDYEVSKQGHSPVMEAVLYFDLQQVITEMERRKSEGVHHCG
jgi:hypothetical protein